MISQKEMLEFKNNNYTVSKILKETNYSLSQVKYACKKYNIDIIKTKKNFRVDKEKVRVLLNVGFPPAKIAELLGVNTRCIYNVMYRNKWTKKRTYIKSSNHAAKQKTGINVSLANVIKFKLGGIEVETTFEAVLGKEAKNIIILK